MKSEQLTLITNKSLTELSSVLRNAASKLRAHIDMPECAPFDFVAFGNTNADISLALSGFNSIFGGPRSWGVEVSIIDMGGSRKVILIAVGDFFMDRMSNGSVGNIYFNLNDSIRRMKRLVELIES